MTGRHQVSASAAVGLVIGTAMVGMTLRGFISSGPDESGQPIGQPVAERHDPEQRPISAGNDSAGFTRNETGAVSAAVSYVVAGQTLLDLPPTRLDEAVRDFAAKETADQQVTDLDAEIDALRDLLADGHGRTRYLQSVLATRLDAFTEDRARVSVWSVGVLWRDGAAEPQAGWTTSAMDLVWERDTWKLWAETITSGPAPAPNAGTPPVNSAELDRLLIGFDPWRAIR